MAKNLVLARAQNAVMAHDWTTAARLYKELLQGNETNVDYLKELGSIYVKAGEDEKAIPYYEKIIESYPHFIEAMNSLGAIYRRLKRYDESIAILKKALEEGRNIPSVNYNLGFTYKEMGQYDDAIEAFEYVIAANPDDVLAYNHMGSIYFMEKNYEKSIASFQRGLQVDPNHPILNYNLARCYAADKNVNDSIRCYENALKTRPGWSDAIQDFSDLLIKCQKNKQAQDLVEKSIKLHPTDSELLCILGRIFLNQYDFDNAAKTYKKADSIKPNDVKILTGFSEALEKNDKIDEALEKVVEATEIDPYNKDARIQYVHTLLSAQRYDQALENVKSLNEDTGEKDLRVLDLYGQYYICRGNDVAAEEYFSKIQRLNHHYKDYMLNASDRYLQVGQLDKAENYAKKFVERRGQQADGYNRLGKIYSQKGDLVAAREQFEKGMQYLNPNVVAKKGFEKVKTQIDTNKELYNTENPPIQINAENVNVEEPYVSPSMVGEVVGSENQFTNEEKVMNPLDESVPMTESLLEKDNDFWEDFDDDPNAQPAALTDEDSEEENLDDDFEEVDELNDLMSSMGTDPLPAEKPEDDEEFSFGDVGDFENQDNELVEDSDIFGDVDDFGGQDFNGVEEEAPAEQAPDPDSERYICPEASVSREASARFSSPEVVESALTAAMKAQEMAYQLKEDQRKFEEELTAKNEQMINEAVEKAIDEKLPVGEESPAEEEVSVEEDVPQVEQPAVEEISEEEAFAELDEFDTFGEDLGETEEEFADVDFFGDEASEEPQEETDIDEEDFLAVDDLAMEPDCVCVAAAEAETEPETVEATADEEDFLDVSEFAEGETVTAEETVQNSEEDFPDVSDFAEEEPVSEEDTIVEEPAAEQKPVFEENISPEEMVLKIERILSDTDTEVENSEKIELFKTLRVLTGFLPNREKNNFLSCRIRMIIEYIIAKMSGKPGLLVTAESLLKSGVLGEEYNSQLTSIVDEELSNDLIKRVLTYMKKLAGDLDDKLLSQSLCVSADNILEQIELANQKSQIF